ncbi:hypothetical protein D3C80_2049250 [compost metagenome]
MARSASHSQGLAGGLRSKLNAIAARNSTLSNNTPHNPNFFQFVPVVNVDAGVTSISPSTVALPNVANFCAL